MLWCLFHKTEINMKLSEYFFIQNNKGAGKYITPAWFYWCAQWDLTLIKFYSRMTSMPWDLR